MGHYVPPLLVIVGPTAVGKTDTALRLARILQGEIISADSMQIYKEMNIGTAKPSFWQRASVPHHLMDIISPADSYSVANWVEAAEICVKSIIQRGRIPMIVGGTGLYIDALIEGFLFPEQKRDSHLRQDLMQRFQEEPGQLYQELEQVDPKAAAKIHPNDARRLIRALEVYYALGRPISELQMKYAQREPKYTSLVCGLTRDRLKLYERIETRVDQMIQCGLKQEVEQLLARYPYQQTALQALGYKEMVAHIHGKMTLAEAVDRIKRDTRRYAKRQLSWFRRKQGTMWYNLDQSTEGHIAAKIFTDYEKIKQP